MYRTEHNITVAVSVGDQIYGWILYCIVVVMWTTAGWAGMHVSLYRRIGTNTSHALQTARKQGSKEASF